MLDDVVDVILTRRVRLCVKDRASNIPVKIGVEQFILNELPHAHLEGLGSCLAFTTRKA